MWFVALHYPGFSGISKTLGKWERRYPGKNTSIGTSTAHASCQTPYISLTLKWVSLWMSVEPQPLHDIVVCCLALPRILSSKIPNAWSMREAVSWWGHIHRHIHSIWSLSNTFYMFHIVIMNEWRASTTLSDQWIFSVEISTKNSISVDSFLSLINLLLVLLANPF